MPNNNCLFKFCHVVTLLPPSESLLVFILQYSYSDFDSSILFHKQTSLTWTELLPGNIILPQFWLHHSDSQIYWLSLELFTSLMPFLERRNTISETHFFTFSGNAFPAVNQWRHSHPIWISDLKFVWFIYRVSNWSVLFQLMTSTALTAGFPNSRESRSTVLLTK